MSHDDDATLPSPDGPFMRAAAVLADLDSPLYAEERERDVWNEASAVGFQFFLWAIPILVAAALWIGGRAALPYVVGTWVIWMLGGVISLGYAARLGVDPAERGPLQGRRAAVYGALMVVLSGGLIRALLPIAGDDTVPGFLRGSAQGGMVGVPLGLLALAVGLWFDARKRRA
jgi:hypothetical protein